MLDRIRRYFDRKISITAGDGRAGYHEHALHLATACLMIEVLRSDFKDQDAERQLINELMLQFTDLQPQEVAELLDLAEVEVKNASSLFQFTSLLDRELEYQDKVRVVTMLWQVVYADGHKDKYEEHLVRKVSDLLHVSHTDYIRCRHLVEDGKV
ncbi:MAG: TerB family tellurite resistance protein [Gammaproteobacteria bacterium]|nr:TerB family tellurite resistance protein [Gammaproteobacteria bacterium]